MTLPGGTSAIVDLRKLREYCLSPTHPLGRHKARRFQAALGLTASDADQLAAWLRQRAATAPARPGLADAFGKRYTIDAEMEHNGRKARIRSAWFVRAGETVPYLTTCYVVD